MGLGREARRAGVPLACGRVRRRAPLPSGQPGARQATKRPCGAKRPSQAPSAPVRHKRQALSRQAFVRSRRQAPSSATVSLRLCASLRGAYARDSIAAFIEVVAVQLPDDSGRSDLAVGDRAWALRPCSKDPSRTRRRLPVSELGGVPRDAAPPSSAQHRARHGKLLLADWMVECSKARTESGRGRNPIRLGRYSPAARPPGRESQKFGPFWVGGH